MNKAIQIVILLTLMITSCTSNKIDFIKNGESSYEILIQEKSPETERTATILQNYISKITNHTIQIQSQAIKGKNYIQLLPVNESMAQDEISIKFEKNNIILEGGKEGLEYAAYTFLEDYVGIKKLTDTQTYYPDNKEISFEKKNHRFNPPIIFREAHLPINKRDKEYFHWHKLNRHQDGSWGMWVHTFKPLVNPKKYFKSHPEYFSLVGGKRINYGQLCLSNPEVLNLLCENLSKKMEEQPEAYYWSVSQNDTHNSCQCENCLALNKKYETESGAMIWFVNQVAERFPNKCISTLAYQYTRKAPKNIKPRNNVNIMLCTIECDRSVPIEKSQSDKSFVKDIEDWGKLTNNIIVWDYVVDFRNYLTPFPNFRVLKENINFFLKNGTHLMFQQGSGDNWSDFSEMKEYVISKLLWNPNASVEHYMKEFSDLYYGKASPYIMEYLTTLHNNLDKEPVFLSIYGFPLDGVESYLRPKHIEHYLSLFDKALEAVKTNKTLTQRVLKAKIAPQFAKVDIALTNNNKEYKFIRNGKLNKEMETLLQEVMARANEHKMAISERHYYPDDYSAAAKNVITNTLSTPEINGDINLLKGIEAKSISKLHPNYKKTGTKALTDGIRGTIDYKSKWIGYEGNDIELLFDLGKTQDIKQLYASFLNDISFWIFLPRVITIETSTDGKRYTKAAQIKNELPVRMNARFVKVFNLTFNKRKARFIKFKAIAQKRCPEWHEGNGNKCWAFTDEIIIQ